MHSSDIQRLQQAIDAGRLTRRQAVQRLVAAGLGLPVVYGLLGPAAPAHAQAGNPPAYPGTRRGGGGVLRCLYWQAPTALNPHFATGTKDADAARLFYEGLARWDDEGDLHPVLAAEIPSLGNGGVAADGKSVTWRLKQGVTWHDGQPFTADDLLFNAAYATDPATAATTAGNYKDLKFVKLDAHTVRVVHDRPTPFWALGYCTASMIPRHVFARFQGAASREAAANFKPVGTGPYRLASFSPGDQLRATLNTSYHLPNRPFFDALEIKGGGDALSAARAVLQSGEFDFAWNLLVEDDLLKRLERSGRGRVQLAGGGTVEFMQLNAADPWTEVDGERSHASTRHPLFSDPAVRQALGLLVDRAGLQQAIWGRTGVATPNFVHNPARFRSPNRQAAFSIDKANAVLDAAGWARGPDGVREKGGRQLRLVFQTSVNAQRQKVQAVVKSACQRAGIEVELKTVTASVFFSGDAANPDTNSQFRADLQMYASSMGMPDPGRAMDRFVSWEVASKANKWQGRNVMRWRNDTYDRLYRASETELDPVRRAALFVQMNDLVCGDGYLIPLCFRPSVTAVSARLAAPVSGWDNGFAWLSEWHRTG